MTRTNIRKYRQEIWEEVAGILTSFLKNCGVLDVNIGKITLILPCELEDTLEPLVGQRISILRTDIPGKYLFRVIPEETPDQEMESAAMEGFRDGEFARR
jgi:hypothetical protein